jgi:peptidyl-prolyl cis-trans isomerase A (cyclophilin A)
MYAIIDAAIFGTDFVIHIKRTAILLLTILTLAIAGCGGGLEKTNITADKWMYNTVTRLTIEGPNLDKGITLVAPKCTALLELPGGSSGVKYYICIPNATGDLVISVVGGSTVLHTATFFVPEPQVTMTTSVGDIVMELNPTASPLSVKNFLQYVSASFYSGLLFHRVVPEFVVQGGGFDIALKEATTRAAIKLEVGNGLSNLRGTVAMARLTEPNSATSQFFINLVDNANLDTLNGGYAVFGKVISGMDTVDTIGAGKTVTRSGLSDLPETPIQIGTVTQTQ